jgi:hypothetical protein
MFIRAQVSFLIILFLSLQLSAQLPANDIRDLALSGSSVALPPRGSITENTAILPEDKAVRISSGVVNNYSIPQLNLFSLRLRKKIGEGSSFTAAVLGDGNNILNRRFYELGLGKSLGKKFSAGIRLVFCQWIPGDAYYSKSSSVIPEISLYSNPFPGIYFGALIRNPVRVRMNAIESSRLPAEIQNGICCRLSDKIHLTGSLHQASDRPLSWHSGVEYAIIENLSLRTGYSSRPVSQSIGFGLRMVKMNLDIALFTHAQLGNSGGIALTFRL